MSKLINDSIKSNTLTRSTPSTRGWRRSGRCRPGVFLNRVPRTRHTQDTAWLCSTWCCVRGQRERRCASAAREREDVRQKPERETMCVRSQTERRCGLEVLHTRHIANGWRCSKVLQKDEPPSFTPTASTHTDRQNVCSDDRVADRPDRILISLFSG